LLVTGGEKGIDHLAIHQERMAVLSIVFRNGSPQATRERALERCREKGERRWGERRAIDGRDHRGIATAGEDFAQACLQRTELAAFGVRIVD
jgi:hypothetical protein